MIPFVAHVKLLTDNSYLPERRERISLLEAGPFLTSGSKGNFSCTAPLERDLRKSRELLYVTHGPGSPTPSIPPHGSACLLKGGRPTQAVSKHTELQPTVPTQANPRESTVRPTIQENTVCLPWNHGTKSHRRSPVLLMCEVFREAMVTEQNSKRSFRNRDRPLKHVSHSRSVLPSW